MGILIEQYRSRIGSHDNFVKTKDIITNWKNHFFEFNVYDGFLQCLYSAAYKAGK